MRRLAFCLSLAACAVLVSAPGPLLPRRSNFNSEQRAALDRISVWLNSVHTLKSGFMQLGPQGQLDQGEFLLEKPGKLRFAYNAPNPTLVIATGGNVYVQNKRLNTVDRYSLSNTPLGLLLDDKTDLKSNGAVTSIDIRDDALVVHARSANPNQQGDIALVFSNPQIELRQWTIKDNQGSTTMVALQAPQPGAAIDDSLFAIPVKASAARKPD